MKPHYTELENGTILIEWVAPDIRFCINIEVDPSESGWCFVTKDGKENDSGYLPPEFLRLLTQRAADFSSRDGIYLEPRGSHETNPFSAQDKPKNR